MPINVTVNDLKINKLTEAQYDAAVQPRPGHARPPQRRPHAER